MGDASGIEWTDATWNPVRGCRKISPGCKHCYAETFAERWRGVRQARGTPVGETLINIRHRKGADRGEWPRDLDVAEFPEVPSCA